MYILIHLKLPCQVPGIDETEEKLYRCDDKNNEWHL